MGFVAAGGAGVAMAQGGLSANLALSGTIFKVTIGDADGQDFSLFVDRETLGQEGNTEPVSRLRFGTVTASDLCVSAKLPDIPGVGNVSFKLESAGQNSVDGENLVVGARVLQGDLTLSNPQLGVDTSQRNPDAPPNSWGLVSDDIDVQARNIDATSVAANTLTVRNATVTVERGSDNVCGKQ
ncbi:DUF6230 family protein [Corynebacterium pelargi]|uniref:DUF6230 family protein n=1 Tax=Corynebacterium pelargi TaxID=1471400 RepID=UPI001E29314C|nr:DUF6230 family protein [Corynebacterium pelargi]